ncbi:MAG TPA: hypothetical protein VGV65_11865, partial [Nocardioides sp.]|nr:hypothetical protein [Nocardioides sp.]
MTDLQQVLREATDHVASPDLAGRALAAAHRTRVRRTSAAALAAVVLLGGGVAWAVQDRVPHADVVDTPTPSPTPSATPSVVDADPATQKIWDPFTVVDAPRRPSVLPEELSPPAEVPSIADLSLPDIVVAWPEEGVDLRVLSSNGEWRSVPGTADAIQGTFRDVVSPAISPDGDRVAMAVDAGILVVRAASGEQQLIDWPSELAGPVDSRPGLRWLPGDEGFVVLHWKRPWLVDLDGTAEPAPFGGPYGSGVMVDPDDGTVRERTRAYGGLRTWNSADDASSVSLGGYGERYATRFGLVAYTGNPGPNGVGLMSGPVVVHPGTGEILGYAPIKDRDSVYSDNGHLTAMGFLDEETVLLLVTPMDFRT